MPFYDTNFNRVHATVLRSDQVPEVYGFLKDRLNSVHVPEPDANGHMSIGIDQAKADDAATAIREMLSRNFEGSGEWITVEPRVGADQSP